MRRSLRSEMLSMSMVLAMPVAIALVFPYASLRFSPSDAKSHQGTTFEFVTLEPAEELEAIRSAKTNWRPMGNDSLRIDMAFGELPIDKPSPVIASSITSRLEPAKDIAFEPSSYLPSQAAPRPTKISPDPNTGKDMAFPRDELLTIRQGL